ncbi:MAG: hypothetical protein JWM74_3427 [Myxococcaceae bacterium]|jgi:uncharacterized protein (DUF2267 family)|nr:hypothetical protein [Myxococcaceae bacterium]
MRTRTNIEEEAFVSRVAKLAGLPSRTEARRAIRATLLELGERLSAGDRAHFADVLPERWAGLIRATEYRGAFDAAELFARVSEREGVELPSAREHAQIVCRVIAERAPVESLARIGRVFPEGIAALFRRPMPVEPARCYRVVRRRRWQLPTSVTRIGSSS